VGDSLDDAGYLYHDLTRILGEDAVAMFPSGYKRDIKYGQVDPPAMILRTEALNRWNTDPTLKAVVTYPEAIAERVASQETLTRHTLRLSTSAQADLTETVHWLRDNGFTEVDYVYEPGHFALRGSILDIFGYSNELPFRVDFFGDDIESIRTFNIETQLSEKRLDEIAITSNVAGQSRGESLLDFIDPSTLMAIRDADFTVERVKAIASSEFSTSAMIADEGDASAMKQVIDADDFAGRLGSFRQVRFSSAARPDPAAQASIDFHCVPQGIYHKNFDLISDSFKRLIEQGFTIYILSDSAKQIERLRSIFDDRGDDIDFTPVISTIHEGFSDETTKICVFTDHQIFDRFHKYNLKSDRARSGKLALSLKELSAIEPGDFIVHIDHGVGRFAGLLRTNVNGRTQEMIKLVYANDDIIFVSIHALHKLAKYRGKEGVPPRVNKLGTGAWNRVKERTKTKLKDIARDLIKLYAARREEKGFAFSPDSYLQHELEASFIYEDTPDQLTATQAVKADMESDRPMDRLVCGDGRLRQDRGRHPRRLQGCRRQQADGRTRPHDRACLSALQHVQGAPARVPRPRRLSLARPHPQAGQADTRRPRRGQNRHPNRHTQTHRQIGQIQGPRPADCRRGAKVWRRRQGKAQADEDQRRHPDHERHPHPAHAPVLAHGRPRPLGHQHSAGQPLSRGDLGQLAQRRHRVRGRQLRAVAQRPDILHQRPHRVSLRA